MTEYERLTCAKCGRRVSYYLDGGGGGPYLSHVRPFAFHLAVLDEKDWSVAMNERCIGNEGSHG